MFSCQDKKGKNMQKFKENNICLKHDRQTNGQNNGFID